MSKLRENKPHEARLLKLAAWILSQSEPATRTQIFEVFEDEYGGKRDTAERKFTRDKDALKQLGFNLETEELGGEDQVGYSIEARSSLLPPLDLTVEEAAAVWTAGVGALRLSQHPLRDELESALRKLVVGTRVLPPRAAAMEELAAEGSSADDPLLPKLVGSWERRRRIGISYWRIATGEVVDREVDVYGWARRRGEWIFVGHDHLRKAVRIFYLSRVRVLKQVGIAKADSEARAKRGGKGDYDIPQGFDVRRWSRQQIWDYDVHPPTAAATRFRGSLAGIAKHLLPGAEVKTDETGARIARLEVRNVRGLVRQALAWGPEAEVIEPAEARAIACEILASAVPTNHWGAP
jgi:predicted DNA-binding transcriptional regulator YafY